MSTGQHNAAIAAIWERQLPQTRERIALLQATARNFSESRSLATEVRSEALEVAHKLAGSLGMFGYMDATEHARLVEQTLDVHGMLPQPERLQKHVDDLAASLAEALDK